MRTCFIMWAGLIICISVLTGCSSTTLKDSSKDAQFTSKVNTVYIIGYADNQSTRQRFEDTVAETLTSYGVTGISSYQDQPVLSEVNDETIGNSVEATGADALLLTMAAGRGTISDTDIIQPDAYKYDRVIRDFGSGIYPQPYYKRYGTYDHVPQSYKPYGSYRQPAFSDYHSFDAPNMEVIYTPTNKHETVIIQTYLFDTQTKKLIWSAELETKSSTAPDTVITDFINTVTDDLKKQGLI